uniref:PH domain-containing protein n=2 Tax=Palpitomonas bilix TaxID=652834 RepID=A0A7S3G6P9_9EUKA
MRDGEELRAQLAEIDLPEDDAWYDDVEELAFDRELFLQRISELKADRKLAEAEQRVDDSIALATRITDLKQAVKERQVQILEDEKANDLDRFDEKHEVERNELISAWIERDESFEDLKQKTFEEIDQRWEAERAELEMKTATAVNNFKPSPKLLSLQTSCKHLLNQQKYDEAKNLLKRAKKVEDEERAEWEMKCLRKLNALEARANQRFNEELRQTGEKFARLQRENEALKKKSFSELQKKRDWRVKAIERKFQDTIKQLDVMVTEKKPVVKADRRQQPQPVQEELSLNTRSLKKMLRNSPSKAAAKPQVASELSGSSRNGYLTLAKKTGKISGPIRPVSGRPSTPSRGSSAAKQKMNGWQEQSPPVARSVQVDMTKAAVQRMMVSPGSVGVVVQKRTGTKPSPLVRSASAKSPVTPKENGSPSSRSSSTPRSRPGSGVATALSRAAGDFDRRSSSVGRARSSPKNGSGGSAKKIEQLAASLTQKRNEWLSVCMELGAEDGMDLGNVMKELSMEGGAGGGPAALALPSPASRPVNRTRATSPSMRRPASAQRKPSVVRNGVQPATTSTSVRREGGGKNSSSSPSSSRGVPAQRKAPSPSPRPGRKKSSAEIILEGKEPSPKKDGSPPGVKEARAARRPSAYQKQPAEETSAREEEEEGGPSVTETEEEVASASDESGVVGGKGGETEEEGEAGDLRIFGELTRQQQGGNRAWEKSFFCVRGTKLECYENETAFKAGNQKEEPVTLSADIWVWPSGANGFEMEYSGKTMCLKAKTSDEVKTWMNLLSDIKAECQAEARKRKTAGPKKGRA